MATFTEDFESTFDKPIIAINTATYWDALSEMTSLTKSVVLASFFLSTELIEKIQEFKLGYRALIGGMVGAGCGLSSISFYTHGVFLSVPFHKTQIGREVRSNWELVL